MSVVTGLIAMTSLPQKLLLGGFTAALICAAGYNVAQAIEIRHLTKKNLSLDTRINDPKVGFVVRLTQAESNSATCTAAVQRQSTALRAQSDRDAATIARTQLRYDREHSARLSAERSAARIVALPPRGDSVAERVTDVDARILEDLK